MPNLDRGLLKLYAVAQKRFPLLKLLKKKLLVGHG